ncbi:MAG: DUF1648 domain-containing protein [Acidobacteria bacterium]|nr:MAG: DUF1648 domain-containing protein [Acidobacteriota bacterium]
MATSALLPANPLPPARRSFRWASLGPFLILAATASLLHANWLLIPARFPVHWDLQGQVNGWATRNFWGVYGMLLLAALFCALDLFLGWATLHWAGHPRGAASPARRRNAAWALLACSYLLALAFSFVALLPLRGASLSAANALVIVPTVLIPCAAAIAVLVAWQSHPAGAHPRSSPPPEPHHQAHWVAGVVYYNPDDPSILVPKQFGFGYTLNFAHPLSWWLLGATGAAITVAMLLSSPH